MEHFWTNTIWYILLGIATLFELIYMMVKAKNRRRAFAFYLTLLGIALFFETAVLIFLQAYSYEPKILQKPPLPFDDVLAGNLFSQTSVSATVALVTILNVKYYWFFILAGLYGIIEESFLALGIYSHNWYRTWMTVLSLPIYFWIAKKMYLKITQGINPLLYYGFIFVALFPPNIATLTWVLMLLRLQDFSTTLLTDPIMSRHFLVLIHFFLLSIPIMLIYFLRAKWIWQATVILIIYILYYLGYKHTLVLIKEGWFLAVSTLSVSWMYLSIFILDRLYAIKDKTRI